MGLINFLKNGLTIEKKVTPVAPEPVEPEVTEEAPVVAPEPAPEIPTAEPEPTPEPAPTPAEIDRTARANRAELFFYADTKTAQAAAATPAPEPKTPPAQQTFTPYSNVSNTFNNAMMGQTAANQNLLVTAPRSEQEMSAILSNLVSGNACIVSLAQLPNPQRHLDFLCGFMSAIGGTIRSHAEAEYILTPPGVGIKS